jgi:prophage maintenance system killer protein
MKEPVNPELVSFLNRLRWQLVEPVDFTPLDHETTAAKVRLLSAAATYFNLLALTEFGGRVGLGRQEGRVEQVVAAAFQTYRGEDPHPTPFDKAAMLMRGITQGHPFTDAHKRTGFLLAVYFLDRMGYVLGSELSLSEVVSFSRRVSAGEIRDLAVIATALRNWTQPRRERSART